jgi:hypothetical protein
MHTNQKSMWQPLTMIPVLNEIVGDMLKASERQLSRLEEVKENPHIFDSATRSRLTQFHTDQNALLPTYLEQCQLWRGYELNTNQRHWVKDIESHVHLLKTVNQEILVLANAAV